MSKTNARVTADAIKTLLGLGYVYRGVEVNTVNEIYAANTVELYHPDFGDDGIAYKFTSKMATFYRFGRCVKRNENHAIKKGFQLSQKGYLSKVRRTCQKVERKPIPELKAAVERKTIANLTPEQAEPVIKALKLVEAKGVLITISFDV